MDLDNPETEGILAQDAPNGAIETPDGSVDDVLSSSAEEENDDQAVDLDAEDEIVLDDESADEPGEVPDLVTNENGDEDNENAPRGGDAPVQKVRGSTCPLDLPISVVRRIMKSASGNRRFTPELISAMSRCAGVFALFLLSASQEATLASGRNSIRPVEVVRGLIACGFPEIAEEARIALDLKSSDIFTRKKKTKKNVKKV